MTYDCLIIDDEKLLADSTAEYFNLFDVKPLLHTVFQIAGAFLGKTLQNCFCWI